MNWRDLVSISAQPLGTKARRAQARRAHNADARNKGQDYGRPKAEAQRRKTARLVLASTYGCGCIEMGQRRFKSCCSFLGFSSFVCLQNTTRMQRVLILRFFFFLVFCQHVFLCLFFVLYKKAPHDLPLLAFCLHTSGHCPCLFSRCPYYYFLFLIFDPSHQSDIQLYTLFTLSQ